MGRITDTLPLSVGNRPGFPGAYRIQFGVWRSLVARLTGGQKARGSNPRTPTIFLPCLCKDAVFLCRYQMANFGVCFCGQVAQHSQGCCRTVRQHSLPLTLFQVSRGSLKNQKKGRHCCRPFGFGVLLISRRAVRVPGRPGSHHRRSDPTLWDGRCLPAGCCAYQPGCAAWR